MELKRGRAKKRPQAELAGGWLSSPSSILREAYATLGGHKTDHLFWLPNLFLKVPLLFLDEKIPFKSEVAFI